MELDKSFKRTDIGLIPSDWELKKLGDLGDSIIGLTYSPNDIHVDGILVLRASNIENDRLLFEDNVYVKKEIPKKLMVVPGDILICVRNGSRRLIGKSALINESAQGMTFGAFMTVFRSPLNNYIFHQFQSRVIKKQINEHLGATINQITNKSLNSFEIPIPINRKERDAIVNVLNDINNLIRSLDRLITKKHAIR